MKNFWNVSVSSGCAVVVARDSKHISNMDVEMQEDVLSNHQTPQRLMVPTTQETCCNGRCYALDEFPEEVGDRMSEMEFRIMVKELNTIINSTRKSIRRWIGVALLLYIVILFGVTYLFTRYIEERTPRFIAQWSFYIMFLFVECRIVSWQKMKMEKRIYAHLEETNDSLKGIGVELEMIPLKDSGCMAYVNEGRLMDIYINIHERQHEI